MVQIATLSAVLVAAAALVSAAPYQKRASFSLQNGLDAQELNSEFETLSADTPCEDGAQACIGGGFAQCFQGKFKVTPCGSGTQCFVLPLQQSFGFEITCTTVEFKDARIADALRP